MRKSILVPALLCAISLTAGAQHRISGKLSCAKASVNEMGGDGGNMVMFSKTNCTWPTPTVVEGAKAGPTSDVEIADMMDGSGRGHGYSTTVYDSGDTTVVRYDGTTRMAKDGSGTFKGTWKFVRGTGKLAGINGSGTYSGKAATDGTGTADIMGHYAIAKGKAKKAM